MMTDWEAIKAGKGIPPINVETPESKKQAEKMGLIYPPENTELKQIVKELHNISQELNTLNRILKQRR